MTTKSFTKDKKGKEEVWEWDDTPEVKDAIANYWRGVKTRQYWNTQSGDVKDEG